MGRLSTAMAMAMAMQPHSAENLESLYDIQISSKTHALHWSFSILGHLRRFLALDPVAVEVSEGNFHNSSSSPKSKIYSVTHVNGC